MAGATAILATLFLSQHALAHAHLASAEPADQATISASPTTLTLTFTEEVEPSFSGVKMVNAEGKEIATGKTVVDSTDKKVLHIPLSTPLVADAYQVDWHVLSVDGHKTKGSYRFTLK
ncbi:copper homeostasis periplasmic binding protein CopC [[Pantoea] beijingensis]|nr:MULTISPECIES: copper homeostasis periplasmic binding protein CopC [Erwiniaceae]